MKKTSLLILSQIIFIVLFFIGLSLIFNSYDLTESTIHSILSKADGGVYGTLIDNARTFYPWAYILTGLVFVITSFLGSLINYWLLMKNKI
jgi:hypothetical protein